MASADKQFFSGKVAWITGASSGIGEELAYILRNHGAKIVISSNEEDELQRVKNNCADHERNVLALPLDLTEFDSFESKTAEVLSHFGKIDILVNNGGISHRSSVVDTSLEVLKKVVDIDFMGHAALTRAALPGMIERKSGHIVVTSSLAGIMSFPTRAAYCASKHALQGFFNALRAEVWKDNIHVTLICPAGVRTKIGYSSLTGEGGKYGKTDKHIEAGMAPEDVARLIVNAIIRKKEEVWIGKFSQRAPAYIARFAPSVFSWLIKHVKSLN